MAAYRSATDGPIVFTLKYPITFLIYAFNILNVAGGDATVKKDAVEYPLHSLLTDMIDSYEN